MEAMSSVLTLEATRVPPSATSIRGRTHSFSAMRSPNVGYLASGVSSGFGQTPLVRLVGFLSLTPSALNAGTRSTCDDNTSQNPKLKLIRAWWTSGVVLGSYNLICYYIDPLFYQLHIAPLLPAQ